MIIIGIVVLIVIFGVFMAIFFIRRNQIENIKGEGKGSEAGIWYGGNFNEFQYIPEESEETGEESDTDEAETESVNPDEAASEAEKIKEEFEKNKPGDVISEDMEQQEIGNSIVTDAMKAENTETEGENPQESMEPADTTDEGIPLLQSDGYAEHEVLCVVQTMEEAEQIAGQIGGTLLEWENGVAKIEIEGSVDDLLEQLEQQGSTLELFRNYYYSIP